MHIVYKKVGETPLECIQRIFNTEKDSYTYAGRLDPMAEGLLLVLVNKECEDVKHYHNLEKEYKYQYVVGIQTDTYDALGRIQQTKNITDEEVKNIEKITGELIGSLTLPYPPYSSKTVKGKALFEYARSNTLHTISIPKTTTTIYSHTLEKIETVPIERIKNKVLKNIRKVRGDFRQQETIEDWESLENTNCMLCTAHIHASAGTYVRGIVHEIGRRLACPTTTVHIQRTRIGNWTEADYGQ